MKQAIAARLRRIADRLSPLPPPIGTVESWTHTPACSVYTPDEDMPTPRNVVRVRLSGGLGGVLFEGEVYPVVSVAR